MAAIAALPALQQNQTKIKFNYIGVIIAAIGAMGYFIGEVMLQLGSCIIAGSVTCSACMWQADKLLEGYKEDKLATNIAAQMSAPQAQKTADGGGIPGWNAQIITTGYYDVYMRVVNASISNTNISANSFYEI